MKRVNIRNERQVYNMGIIGNCSYIACIDTSANVVWMCLPRFDSSFIFGSLLDSKKGGEFSVLPATGSYSSRQFYEQNTNILRTEFHSRDGEYAVIDFAPRFYQYDRYYRPLMLMRKIVPLKGDPLIRVICRPVGDYGRIVPETVRGSNHIRFLNLDSQVRLTSDIPPDYIMEEKSFVLSETRYLVFTYGVPLEASLPVTVESFYENTRKYWQNWIKTTFIPSIFQEQIIRSALVLKLHQYEDTGGIIAAATTSLPENNGSGRTWDYRFCWMRDTFYTLNAFHQIGHFEELEKYFNFIRDIILNEKERIHPLYTILGQPVKGEKQLELEGFRRNQPVRIGNNAYMQVQNDIYGQILISLLPLFIDKRLDYYDRSRTLAIVKWLLDRISETLDKPDAGIWEFGNILQLHCYTMLFHWAGSKAAARIAEVLKETKLKKMAEILEAKSSANIEKCYDARSHIYTQAIGSPYPDASGLQLITMNYLDHKEKRTRIFLDGLHKELATPDGLIFRYNHEDELGKPSTSFLVCGFWLAESLACVGRIDEAYRLVEKIISYSNHLGLFSEDADFKGGQWGNFPQTYTHVGLINSVYRISVRNDKSIFL